MKLPKIFNLNKVPFADIARRTDAEQQRIIMMAQTNPDIAHSLQEAMLDAKSKGITLTGEQYLRHQAQVARLSENFKKIRGY